LRIPRHRSCTITPGCTPSASASLHILSVTRLMGNCAHISCAAHTQATPAPDADRLNEAKVHKMALVEAAASALNVRWTCPHPQPTVKCVSCYAPSGVTTCSAASRKICRSSGSSFIWAASSGSEARNSSRPAAMLTLPRSSPIASDACRLPAAAH